MNKTKEEDIIKTLESKIQIPQRIYPFIDFDKLVDLSLFFYRLPQKQSAYIDNIFKLLDFLSKNQRLSKLQVFTARKKILSEIESYLCKEHGFVSKTDWWTGAVFGFVLDIIFLILGISKHYCYIPIFAIFSIINHFFKLKKAKREGKYIDW